MDSTKDQVGFQFLTEVGIVEQLARNQLERSLPDGLKMAQFGVLNHLVRLGGEWSPVRLAKAFQVTKGAMTNTLQRLEKRKLVQIRDDETDGRKKRVSITEAGRVVRQRCVECVAPQLAEISREIPDAELLIALPVLEKLRKHLDTHRS